MPIESAAILLSRTAMMARPERLLIKLSTRNSVISTSTKPETKVEMRETPRNAHRAVDDHFAALLEREALLQQAEVQTCAVQADIKHS